MSDISLSIEFPQKSRNQIISASASLKKRELSCVLGSSWQLK